MFPEYWPKVTINYLLTKAIMIDFANVWAESFPDFIAIWNLIDDVTSIVKFLL